MIHTGISLVGQADDWGQAKRLPQPQSQLSWSGLFPESYRYLLPDYLQDGTHPGLGGTEGISHFLGSLLCADFSPLG